MQAVFSRSFSPVTLMESIDWHEIADYLFHLLKGGRPLMHRSVVVFRVMFNLSRCLAGKPIVNVLWVQLEELLLRKECVLWVPRKFMSMCVCNQVAEGTFIVIVSQHATSKHYPWPANPKSTLCNNRGWASRELCHSNFVLLRC